MTATAHATPGAAPAHPAHLATGISPGIATSIRTRLISHQGHVEIEGLVQGVTVLKVTGGADSQWHVSAAAAAPGDLMLACAHVRCMQRVLSAARAHGAPVAMDEMAAPAAGA